MTADRPCSAAVSFRYEAEEVRRSLRGATFASIEAMRQLIEMGMEEGLRQAMGQIDGILADGNVSTAGSSGSG